VIIDDSQIPELIHRLGRILKNFVDFEAEETLCFPKEWKQDFSKPTQSSTR